ncbi:hypothetical protein E2C01_085658 [Portunus trituberculatus]|uniref:Uncharacterized protein n=1 Tax=Portunus trituberculatus TaxID=210409 RepID=A0A5B7IYQ2_PORTR|nr:hypothetical protein [Portunus trituberculatus]
MPRSEIFFPADAVKDYPPDYSLDEAALHPLVHRVLEEDDELSGDSSPVNSPRFSRRGTRRELKKFRESTSRRSGSRGSGSRGSSSRGPGSWSPDVTRPASVRSTCESCTRTQYLTFTHALKRAHTLTHKACILDTLTQKYHTSTIKDRTEKCTETQFTHTYTRPLTDNTRPLQHNTVSPRPRATSRCLHASNQHTSKLALRNQTCVSSASISFSPLYHSSPSSRLNHKLFTPSSLPFLS